MKWRLLVIVGREREWDLLLFFFTLIKSRDTLQWKKHDEKQSSHELKAGRGRQEGGDGQRQTNRQLLTNSCTEGSTDREGEREGRGGTVV